MKLTEKELERRRRAAPFNDPEVRAKAVARSLAARETMTPEQKEERRVAWLLKSAALREAKKQKRAEQMAAVEAKLRAMVEGAGTLRDRMADPARAKVRNKDIRSR